MSYKKIFLKVIVIFVIYISVNSTLIYGRNTVNTTSTIDTFFTLPSLTNNEQIINDNEIKLEKKITTTEYTTIQKILEKINKEIKSIDERIILVRGLEEYEKYPAVRLNIDTPYFGINSMINSKFKIRNNVSTVDIASGYSIKDIINKKVIKLESFKVSNIIIATKDVTIDENMTSKDAQTCIFKLLEYLSQTKSVNKFVDKQLDIMLRGYYSKDKIEKINKINEKINETETNLNIVMDELSYINGITENDIAKDIDLLYKYKDDSTNTKIKIKSVLLNNKDLDKIYENTILINDYVKILKFNTNKKYTDVVRNIDLEKAVYLINLKMNNELVYLQKYIDSSKVEINQNKDINKSNKFSEKTNKNINEKTNEIKVVTENDIYLDDEIIVKKEYEEKYKLTSIGIFDSMKKDIIKTNEILDKVVKNSLVTDNIEKEKLNSNNVINELLQVYIRFMNKEVVFLTENSKINITEIKKSNTLNLNSFEDIEYIYINLSDILTRISDNFESLNIISNIKAYNSLKEVLNKVIVSQSNLKQINSENIPL